MARPRLALTLGDPAGVGPAAVLLALKSPVVRKACDPILVGEKSCWRRAGWRPGLAHLIDTELGLAAPVLGRPSRTSGRLSFESLRRSCELAGRKTVEGIVTAPISKTAWSMAGIRYPGHTEYLREYFGAPKAEMALGAPSQRLWCVLASRHVPLSEAVKRLKPAAILSAAKALDAGLRRLGLRKPRLALCALNPHGGEGGLLGGEEKRVLSPAVSSCRQAGLNISGPIAADTAWRLHQKGKFDGLVCLYHDQALIPLKVAAGLSGINWTVGLPVVRVSPAHGTAFDAARGRRIDPAGTVEAILLAARLAARAD